MACEAGFWFPRRAWREPPLSTGFRTSTSWEARDVAVAPRTPRLRRRSEPCAWALPSTPSSTALGTPAGLAPTPPQVRRQGHRRQCFVTVLQPLASEAGFLFPCRDWREPPLTIGFSLHHLERQGRRCSSDDAPAEGTQRALARTVPPTSSSATYTFSSPWASARNVRARGAGSARRRSP